MADPTGGAASEREAIKARWARLRAEMASELKELRIDAAEGLDRLDAKIQELRDKTTLDEKATDVWEDVEAKARSFWADLKADFQRRRQPPGEPVEVKSEGEASGEQ